MRGILAIVTALAAALVASAPAAAQNPWTAFRTLNIAHQGGEAEAPSNTMYAYKRALRLGADMLEVDFHSTADDRLVVLHDADVERTTDGSGKVYDMTLREVRALDAAHDFIPGIGTKDGFPAASYPFRGVRAGELPPPPGYRPRDFRIPTLDELLRAFPDVPINIEIKGRADTDVDSFLHNAELLAGLLNRSGRSEGVIVASFNDAALERFHVLAPQIDLAPATAAVAAFKFANVPPPPGTVAFQVPITFSGIQVTDPDFVERAHAQGYAVHVWLSNDGEDTETYNRLLDWNVDGVMSGEPGAFEQVLCERGISRPSQGWARHCRYRRGSIACSVRAATDSAAVSGSGVVHLRLRRRDDFEGRCAGRVRIRLPGATVGSARFDFGTVAPASGGPRLRVVEMRLRPDAAAAVRRAAVRARVEVTPYDAFTSHRRLRLSAL